MGFKGCTIRKGVYPSNTYSVGSLCILGLRILSPTPEVEPVRWKRSRGATRAAHDATDKRLHRRPTMSESERAQALHYRQQVEALFDDYAPDFESSLLSLGYDIPAEMVHELQRDGAQRDGAAADAASSTISHTLAVDLGCGTGLAGAAMRPFCQGKLLGCDLSSGMLRLAKKKRGPDERRVL